MLENCTKSGFMEHKDVEKVKKFLKNLGIKVEHAYLFGSRAKGNALKTSDFDVIIVSPDYAQVNWFQRITNAYKKWVYAQSLEPLCYTPQEFSKKKNQLGIVKEAIETGVKIV